MQLKDITKPLDQQTDAELLERLRQIRHRRDIIRPAVKARADREEKQVSNRKMSAVEKMLANLSEEDRLALMSQLGDTSA